MSELLSIARLKIHHGKLDEFIQADAASRRALIQVLGDSTRS
jgi:hypothetical protein